MIINNISEDFLLIATVNILEGLSEFGLDFDLFVKLNDMCHNGFYDVAYDMMCDFDVKMTDSDRASLKYLFYHAKEDYKRIQNILDA